MGASLSDGTKFKMKQDSQSYGVQARSILVKCAILMIKNKIYIGSENYIDIWR